LCKRSYQKIVTSNTVAKNVFLEVPIRLAISVCFWCFHAGHRLGAFAAILYAPSTGLAGPSQLGSAQSFAVLGHETVTNGHSDPNPTTQIYGNLGVTPGTSVTGFNPTGTVSGGTIHINDGVAQLALADATTAYNTLAGLAFDYNYTGVELGSAGYTTLTPGVYHFNTSAQLTGALTLDFQGNPDADFIFQIGSTLTTASSSSVNVINGGPLSGVYWQVVSSATLGTDTTFAGNILALASVSLDPRAEILCGRGIALTGAVTLVDNLISNNNTAEDFSEITGYERSDFGSYGFSGGSPTVIPAPGALLLVCSGLVSLFSFRKRFRAVV
jgi:type VI secretion system secreted protein VgrG